MAILFSIALISINVIICVYGERKLSAFMQDRLGPMENGKWGTFQLFADLLKLIQKEDIVPKAVSKKLFLLAPWLIFLSIFGAFSVIPFGAENWFLGSNNSLGIMILIGILGLDSIGILFAGWSSNNKFSLLGAVRSVAQILSFEVPMGLILLSFVLLTGTLNLQEISLQQGIYSDDTIYLFGLKSLGFELNHIGGIFSWNIVRMPLYFILFIVYFIVTLAESNRAPFDIPEAESELVGGFHTEYSGLRWAILFMSEYGMMLLLSVLGVVLFFGGYYSPFPNLGSLRLADWTNGNFGEISGIIWGLFWLLFKSYIIIVIQMWVRWTLPRVRVDQLMEFSWKFLVPLSLGFVAISAVWSIF